MPSAIRTRPWGALAALLSLAACGLPMPPAGTVGAPQNMVERAAPSEEAGCFSGQLGVEPWALTLAQAAVRLTTPSGRFAGSGFIVHDSGDASDPHNRILSGVHVLDPPAQKKDDGVKTVAPRDQEAGPDEPAAPKQRPVFNIIAYNGARIGQAVEVARAAPGSERIRDGRILPRGDIAAMRITSFFPGGEALYNRIRGVDLSPIQSDHLFEGLISDPGGVDGGASGSLIADASTGRAVGLMLRHDLQSAQAATDLWQVRHKVQAGAMLMNSVSQAYSIRDGEVSLPVRAWGFGEPITDPEILAALGAAGFAVRQGVHLTDAVDVQSPGFPMGYCVIYRGAMRPDTMISFR